MTVLGTFIIRDVKLIDGTMTLLATTKGADEVTVVVDRPEYIGNGILVLPQVGSELTVSIGGAE